MYVKNGINCIRRIDIEDTNIECVWVEIKPKNAKSFLVGSIYRNPDSKIKWRDFFESHIEKVQLEDKEIILLGDMNRDLLNTRINTEWTEFTNSLGLTQLVKTPTRISANSKTLIDHIYTDYEENIVNVNVPDISISDHNIILCSRKVRLKDKKHCHQTIKYRSFKNFNESQFLCDLQSIPWHSLNTITDTNDLLNMWLQQFSSVVDKHVPHRLHRVKNLHQPDFLTPEILDTIKLRDKNKAQNNLTEFKKLRNKVTQLIKDSKKQSYEKKIEEGKSDPKSIWKIFKEHGASSKKIQKSNNINQLNIDGCEITDNKDIANEFNNFFVNIATKLSAPIPESDFNHIKDHVDNKVPKHTYFQIPLITEDKTRKYLNSLDISKATGLDQLGPRLLKMSTNIITSDVTRIINLSINNGIFPDTWKHAKVSPLFKSGSPADINNYRPISILPTLSKIIEKHVHESFLLYLNNYKLLCETQSGFRKHHSCETALVHMIDKWLGALNEGKYVGCVMLDFLKSFDTYADDTTLFDIGTSKNNIQHNLQVALK